MHLYFFNSNGLIGCFTEFGAGGAIGLAIGVDVRTKSGTSKVRICIDFAIKCNNLHSLEVD